MTNIAKKSFWTVILGPIFLIPGLGIPGLLLSVLSYNTITDPWTIHFWGLITGVVGFLYAIPVTLVYGLPVLLILNRFNRLSFVPVMLLSLLPVIIIQSYLGPSVGSLVFFGYCSLVVAWGCFYVFTVA